MTILPSRDCNQDSGVVMHATFLMLGLSILLAGTSFFEEPGGERTLTIATCALSSVGAAALVAFG